MDPLNYQSDGVALMGQLRSQMPYWGDEYKQGAIDWNLKQLEYQQNVDMWNRQNEYNSPAAQMQRFASAGLNPNLIYQQGNPGNASSAPQFSAPSFRGELANNQLNRSLSIISAVSSVGKQIMDMIGQTQGLEYQRQQIQGLELDNNRKWLVTSILGNTDHVTSQSDPDLIKRMQMQWLVPGSVGNEVKNYLAPMQYENLRSNYERNDWYRNVYGQKMIDLIQGKIDMQDYMNQVRQNMPAEWRTLYDLFLPLLLKAL